MKQLIIILVVLAVALFIVVGCKDGGKNGFGLSKEAVTEQQQKPHPLLRERTVTPKLTIDSSLIDGLVGGGTVGGWSNGWTKDVDTLPFLNVLKDTTFKLSRMKVNGKYWIVAEP